MDNSGRVFITGGFRYTSLFGSISLKTSNGNADIFIACYDSSGNAIWAKKAGGSDNDSGRGIAVDANSNVFITGNCGLIATFGTKTIYGKDNDEIYFASYNVSGNYRWVLQALGAVDALDPDRYIEMGLCISTDPFGNVLAAGDYRSSSTFGSTTLSPWSTHTQIFVTKIKSSSMMLPETFSAQIIPSQTATYCKGGDVMLRIREDSAHTYKWMKDGEIIKGATACAYNASSPGSYSVMIISGTDTLTTEPTLVSESQNIEVSIAPSDPVFCQDTGTVLIANTGDEFVYQWSKDGITIPEATSKSLKADKSGNYQVKIMKGSCFYWSGITNVSLQTCKASDSSAYNNDNISDDRNTISFETKDDSLLVKIYPNPNNGLFTLELSMKNITQVNEQALVEVLNSVGQTVYYKIASFESGYINERIELEDSVPSGIYFLQVSIGDKVEKTRMMLAR